MGRQRQVDCVREHERKLAFQAQQRQVADALALLMRPFRPEVLSRLQPWVSQYQSVQLIQVLGSPWRLSDREVNVGKKLGSLVWVAPAICSDGAKRGSSRFESL